MLAYLVHDAMQTCRHTDKEANKVPATGVFFYFLKSIHSECTVIFIIKKQATEKIMITCSMLRMLHCDEPKLICEAPGQARMSDLIETGVSLL